MSGYYGYSMSNNAVAAYESGEMPLSKWRKSDIIAAVENAISEGAEIQFELSELKKLRVNQLKNLLLKMTSWHHTSKFFNVTDFYSFDSKALVYLTSEDIQLSLKDNNSKPEKSAEKWECRFLEWGGSKRHPKATEYIEEGTIIGDWFIRSNGKKKSIHANGFKKIRKL